MKLRPNTLVTLGASAVFGLAAVFLARSWINNSVEAEFQTAQTISETIQVPLNKTITQPVVVANIDMNFGDTLSREMLKIVEYPEDSIPAGAYGSIDELMATLPRRVLLNHIAQFEPMLPHKISGEGGRKALSEMISEGKRAVTFKINTTSGVGGYILPNDRVDVLYVKDITADTNTLTQNTIVTNVVFQNMKVLGVDLQSNQQSETIASRKSVTLEVTNEEAQKLILMENSGKLVLTLRGSGQNERAPEYTAKLKDIFGKIVLNGSATQAPHRAANNIPDENLAEVTIFRGEERSEVSVKNDTAPLNLGKITATGAQ